MATRKKKSPVRSKVKRPAAAARKPKAPARGAAPELSAEVHFRGAVAVERDPGRVYYCSCIYIG